MFVSFRKAHLLGMGLFVYAVDTVYLMCYNNVISFKKQK